MVKVLHIRILKEWQVSYIPGMAEESKNDKYLICSKCRSKYTNYEEHISNRFGHTRLEERYDTCV